MNKHEEQYRRPQPQDPVADQNDDALGDITYQHPAFAQISANRVSGRTVLYGSDFQHNSFVRISIRGSKLRRSLANDWPHASLSPYIEVDLSEAQWAHFVSSLNVGMGSQCTLVSRNGEDIPGLKLPADRRAQFQFESDERWQKALQSMTSLRDTIKDSGLSKSKQADLLRKLESVYMNVTANQQYVADQFSEHMDATVEKAKAEVDGYIMGATRQLGLQAIAAGKAAGVEPLHLTFPASASPHAADDIEEAGGLQP